VPEVFITEVQTCEDAINSLPHTDSKHGNANRMAIYSDGKFLALGYRETINANIDIHIFGVHTLFTLLDENKLEATPTQENKLPFNGLR
jgi:hypothetical protein